MTYGGRESRQLFFSKWAARVATALLASCCKGVYNQAEDYEEVGRPMGNNVGRNR